MMRVCRTCNASKSEGDYYLNKGVPLADCKKCHGDKVKLRRLTDPKVREYDRQRGKLPHRLMNSVRVTKEWRAKNPQAYAAQTSVGNALRDGKLKREPCGICSSTDDIHAHHKDYAKQLDIVWLCARCHHRLHALFPELEGLNKVFSNVGN